MKQKQWTTEEIARSRVTEPPSPSAYISPAGAVASFTDRKRIREELQRSETESFREDVATLCCCPDCGGYHYRPRTETKQDDQVK